MPLLGKEVASATIVRLVKQLGDPVQVGDVAAEVSIDKVDVEIPATTAGTVAAVFVREGDEVPVGFPLLAVSPPAARPRLADDPPQLGNRIDHTGE
ncbi:biotin/lipoyl-containing protein [Micromonospora chersina]|uniref:biotin/lipoyl-containing protein n=1 Tax=Micromonospora chersina TaxID=47854 RepID=UPI003D8C6940